MTKKILLSGALSFLALGTLLAQPTLVEKVEATAGKVVIPYERWKLPNGLTILLHEDHSDPVVNIMVTYNVGSNRESLGKSGFAHFFEHMMFQGSKHVGDEQHFKMVSTAGGDMNGFTQRDKTVYYETLPSNYLEMGLWLESDRMGFLLDSLTTKKFENQRDAVKNEKSQNIENRPYAMAFVEEINKTLYPPGHPYSWPVIGYVDDLNRADLNDVKNFFLRWYGPNNAIVSLSGDFKPADALALVDKYFGDIKQCPEVKKLRVAPVTIATDKYTAYRDKTYFPLNLRVFPTVPQYHRDEAALDMLGTMMGQGNNSVFYKKFVKSKLAVQASADHGSDELSGEFQIAIFAYPPEDFNLEKLFTDIDAKVKEAIDEFGQTGITDEALARAKGQVETRAYDQINSVWGKNATISEWERLLGRSSNVTDEVDRYARLTKEDISRVFNKYIKGSGAAVLNTYPIVDPKDSVKSVNPYAGQTFPVNPEYKGLTYTPAVEKFNRSVKPTEGSAKTVKVPEYFSSKLKNGMGIIGTKNAETPEIAIVMTMEGGSLVLGKDKIKKLGIAELTASMLNEGTKNFTTEEISSQLDVLGSSISFDASKASTTIRVNCLKKNFNATLKILEEKLLSPGFREEDFKLAKKQYKEGVRDEETNANAIASKMFAYALYENSVMGLSPTTKSIDNIELADVKEYYTNYYSPSVTNLVIVGDIEEKDVMTSLEFLNKWASKEVVIQPIDEPVASVEPKFFIYNKSLAPSSIITMGYPSLKFDATGDYYKNRIANFVFGGAFNSRLNLNLREDKGYTYGIRSGFNGGKYTGTFQISAAVKRSSTALSLAEVIKEFKKYETGGITDSELEYTKSALLNTEAIKYEDPYQKADFLASVARFNLEKDYTVKQNQILKNMTKDDLNQQIKKHFDSNKLTTVVVGDKWIIESLLDKASKEENNKDVLNKVKLKKISID
ncbi:M16 family metallopeptidase [Aurantibacillus circumpalustris]|uniref:M16 family metallopeptidase n=1 Tax=Aurantibacillus circumpalustris TaxID=3036359 RepID=UPI00295A60BD|nr:pitrilysin family protein [Aurantibacillus circumpalustris]